MNPALGQVQSLAPKQAHEKVVVEPNPAELNDEVELKQEDLADPVPEDAPVRNLRPRENLKAPEKLNLVAVAMITAKEAIQIDHADEWKLAMQDDRQPRADGAPGKRLLPAKWVLKLKLAEDDKVSRFKSAYLDRVLQDFQMECNSVKLPGENHREEDKTPRLEEEMKKEYQTVVGKLIPFTRPHLEHPIKAAGFLMIITVFSSLLVELKYHKMHFFVVVMVVGFSCAVNAGFASHDAGGYGGGDFGGHGGGFASGSGLDLGGHGGDIGGGGFEEHHHGGHLETKTVEVTKPVHVPVIKKIGIPVPHPVGVPVPQVIKVPVPQPYPVHIPVPQPIAVPIYKLVPQEIEKKVPITIEKPVPYPVEKPYKIEIEKHHPVHIAKPYPVHVPVYKHVYHHVPKHGWQ
ncbi:uncharacterized protein LOC116175541 [Photinus pyralis]|nr:uncharacterized protein LOC116175541 [Photinus pyralis]